MIKRVGALVFALTLLFAFAVPVSADTSGFTFYEYLESDGTSYVATDVRPTERTGIWIDGQWLGNSVSTDGYVVGEQGTESFPTDRYTLMINVAMGQQIYITKSPFSTVRVTVPDATARMIISLDSNNNYSVGGVTGALTGTPQNFTAVQPLYIFGRNGSGTPADFIPYRLYGLKLYDGETVIRDFVAAKNSSGVYGLYDQIDGGFYPASDSNSFTVGSEIIIDSGEPTVAEKIENLNTQIHEIESTIYEDLHTYSAQIDPSTAANFSGNFLSAMSFISDTWTSAYNQLGDMQVIITFPLFLAIAMLFIGRMNSVIASGAMKSRKNNDKKGGGDVG